MTGGPLPHLGGPEERGDSQTPPPLTSPQAIPGLEELATPAGHSMPGVLRNLSPYKVLQAMSNADNPPMEEGLDAPSVMEEEDGESELLQQVRIQEAQARTPPSTFLAKA